MTEIADKDIREALDRISRTRDGEILYLFLQKTLMGVTESSDTSVLQIDKGRRIFARDLMAHMGEGVSTSARSGCITFVTAPRSAPRSRAPGGRLVTADTAVPGFDAPDPDADSRPAPGGAS